MFEHVVCEMTAILSRGRRVNSVTSATLNVASRHAAMCQTESLGKLVRVVTVGSNAHINGLVQERRNPSALTMELYLSCTNPSICFLSVKIIYTLHRQYSSL